MKQYFEFT